MVLSSKRRTSAYRTVLGVLRFPKVKSNQKSYTSVSTAAGFPT